MSRVPAPYRLAVRAARAAAPVLALADARMALGIAGRRGADATLASWAADVRDPGRPTAWFHAPSVGEALQAGAVIHALRERRPELQVAFTHFSPSAEAIGARIGADIATYLPWDVEQPVARVLDAMRPDLLVFTKTEVWPVLVDEAVRRDVPVVLVAGAVPPGAGRLRWAARLLLGGTWSRLSLACASSQDDAAGLKRLGVRAGVVHVTGDPGIDAAARRAEAAAPGAPHLAPFHRDPRPTVVAGSTWQADEAVLLPALGRLRRSMRRLRVVIAPHEPDAARVDALLDELGRYGWITARLSDVESDASSDGADAVVVDQIGKLAHLYTIGTVAYVGGGFRGRGLHSVLEPAAAQVPVVFGPKHENARAAADLLRAGGAKIAADADSLARFLAGWLEDRSARNDAGKRAFHYIVSHRGAAERTAALLAATLESKRPI